MSREESKKGFWYYMWKSHLHFVTTSYSFMQGTPRVKYYSYYPIAYIKFMRLCITDYFNYKKTNHP